MTDCTQHRASPVPRPVRYSRAVRGRGFLRLLLVLGIFANVAFLLINFSPDRPHLSSRRKLRVLLRTHHTAASWIKQNELDEFGAKNDVDLEVVVAASFDDVITTLKEEQ